MEKSDIEKSMINIENDFYEQHRATKMEKFKYAQAGDKVFSVIYGWGEVAKPFNTRRDRLEVGFPTQSEAGNSAAITKSYLADGRSSAASKHPELYWNEPFIKDMHVDYIASNYQTKRWSASWADKIPHDRRNQKESWVELNTANGATIRIHPDDIDKLSKGLYFVGFQDGHS